MIPSSSSSSSFGDKQFQHVEKVGKFDHARPQGSERARTTGGTAAKEEPHTADEIDDQDDGRQRKATVVVWQLGSEQQPNRHRQECHGSGHPAKQEAEEAVRQGSQCGHGAAGQEAGWRQAEGTQRGAPR